MTLLQQEKASEKSSLEKQIEDAQQSLDKKEKEILVVRGELQEVSYFVQSNFSFTDTLGTRKSINFRSVLLW